ncbi:MAG: hypothetical protein MH825_13610 [Cyanobacteria bacterium]|nr:hypothetical protein [Cyanobacteriota bacterium]
MNQTGIMVKFHDDEFPQSTLDTEWLPIVGQRDWVVLTKDAAIGRNALERRAVARANLRLFTLTRQDLTGAEMAAVLVQALGAMQRFVHRYPAPFIAKVDRAGKIRIWRDRAALLGELGR